MVWSITVYLVTPPHNNISRGGRQRILLLLFEWLQSFDIYNVNKNNTFTEDFIRIISFLPQGDFVYV